MMKIDDDDDVTDSQLPTPKNHLTKVFFKELIKYVKIVGFLANEGNYRPKISRNEIFLVKGIFLVET